MMPIDANQPDLHKNDGQNPTPMPTRDQVIRTEESRFVLDHIQLCKPSRDHLLDVFGPLNRGEARETKCGIWCIYLTCLGGIEVVLALGEL